MKIKEAIILAGGLGTRLQSVVPNLPKCMAAVAGKPFLSYIIDYYTAQGIEKFIFSLGYKHEIIEDYLNDEYTVLDMEYVIEEKPLGTGGAIQFACQNARDKNIMVVNGDTLFKINLETLSALHIEKDAACTLCLKPLTKFDRYGVVEMKEDSSVKSFEEKKFYEEGTINGGVYALNVAGFLDKKLPAVFSFEKDYLEAYCKTEFFYGCIQDNYFIDIGVPEDFERAQKELAC